ncbi:MAG: hypothetical protein H0U73_02000 [Tatlockia sp.]|nr:hypothetical protein [Tatlockia sp.]
MLNNLSLLPHDHSIIVKDITQKLRYIQLMKALLKELQQALFFFENQEFSYFDAQVGETLCQIRAYKIYSLSVQLPSLKTLLLPLKKTIFHVMNTLDTYETKYQLFLKQPKKERPDYSSTPTSLIDFFLAMECVLSLPEETLFIFLSYFLCKYKIVNHDAIPIGINFQTIAETLNLSSGYSKKLAQFYQKMLSELSCHFIFKLLNELPEKDHLKQILPWLHRRSDEGRMVLPCYSVTEIIIFHMIKKETPVVLLVDIQDKYHNERIAFGFQGYKSSQNFEPRSHFNKKVATPCVVLYGTCWVKDLFFKDEFINQLLTIGMKEVVLYNNSSHPQYSGSTLSLFKVDPFDALIKEQQDNLSLIEIEIAQNLSYQLAKKQTLAEQTGCTTTNQSLFFLKHIFCNTTQAYANYYLPDAISFKEETSHERSSLTL